MVLVALACGCVASLPFVHVARREVVALRLRPLGGAPRARVDVAAKLARAARRRPQLALVLRVAGAPRRRRIRRRQEAVVRRELPVVIDLVGVAVSAGCTPFHAVEHASRFGPPQAATVMGTVVRDCARGRSFDDALRELALSAPALRPLAEALRASAQLGTPAAPALARLATEVRADVRRRAEARARTVPVRLCFPLVACVLPAFALLTVVPAVLGGLHP